MNEPLLRAPYGSLFFSFAVVLLLSFRGTQPCDLLWSVSACGICFIQRILKLNQQTFDKAFAYRTVARSPGNYDEIPLKEMDQAVLKLKIKGPLNAVK